MNRNRSASLLMGKWSIEPKWFSAAVNAVRSGAIKPRAEDDYEDDSADDEGLTYSVQNGIATICIDGQMTKHRSSFGGTSTVEVRRAIRAAAADFMVRGIMLHISSPGGTVAGTADLAEDVASAGQIKPVFAYIADMGASAAYWVASQARRISSNVTALVGSIGTYCVLEDDSAMLDAIGVKYTVVSSGAYKGLGADGKVNDALVADVQREINELNEHFLAAISAGRSLSPEKVTELADGRVHVGQNAVILGLIDTVESFDAAMQALSKEIAVNTEQFKAFAAQTPDAVKETEPYKAVVTDRDNWRAKAEELERQIAAAKPKNATAAELKAAFPDDRDFVMDRLDVDAPMVVHEKAFIGHQAAKLSTVAKERDDAKNKLAELDPAHAGTTPVNTGTTSVGNDGAVSPQRQAELLNMSPLGRAATK